VTASKTETILSAIETALGATAGVSGRVWRDRAEAVVRAESPAILLEALDEDPMGETTCRYDWLLRFRVVILVRNGAVSQVADPIRTSVHSIIMGDSTIQSMASILRPGTVRPPGTPWCQWLNEKGDGEPGGCVLTYEIGHRSLKEDLTS
jgi:hypothetical protein